MARIFTIVKRNSVAHQAAKASVKVSADQVLPVAGTHVLVPSARKFDVGNLVSHAKNRVRTRREGNMQELKLKVGEVSRSIRLSNHDLRTYKKLTKAQPAV